MTKKIVFIICFIFLSLSQVLNAHEINIQSNKLNLDREKNISIFTGNVHAWNKDFKIWSDKLIIEYNENDKEIKKIIAEKNVKIMKEDMSVKGNSSIYLPLSNKMHVMGEISINNNGNVIYCDELTLDLDSAVSIMSGNASKRVEAIIIIEETNANTIRKYSCLRTANNLNNWPPSRGSNGSKLILLRSRNRTDN